MLLNKRSKNWTTTNHYNFCNLDHNIAVYFVFSCCISVLQSIRCYYKLAADAETSQSCPETLTLSECCRSHGDEDLAPGQMTSIFSCSFRRCRVSLKGSVAPQGWLTHLSPLHPHVQPSEQTPDRKAASQVTLLSPDTGSVPQITDCWCNYTPHTARLTSDQLESTRRRPALNKAVVWAKHCPSAL